MSTLNDYTLAGKRTVATGAELIQLVFHECRSL